MSSYRIEIQHQHAQYCINGMEQPRHRGQHQRQVRFSTVREGEGTIQAHVRSPALPLQFYPHMIFLEHSKGQG